MGIWLPTTKIEWARDQELYHAVPQLLVGEIEVIQRNVDWLLAHLYEPAPDVGAHFTGRYLVKLGVPKIGVIDKEPINWGDLCCSRVSHLDAGFLITLEEASPGQCPALCSYIHTWLTAWGWDNVEVQTEW